MRMRDELEQKVGLRFSKGLLAATNQEIYQALLELTQEKLAAARPITGERKLYYISAEFLVGKLLSNNLINLGLYDEVKADPGRGGQGYRRRGGGGAGALPGQRRAWAAWPPASWTPSPPWACPGTAWACNYHFGLFRQLFQEHKQQERARPLDLRPKLAEPHRCALYRALHRGLTLTAVLYDIVRHRLRKRRATSCTCSMWRPWTNPW